MILFATPSGPVQLQSCSRQYCTGVAGVSRGSREGEHIALDRVERGEVERKRQIERLREDLEEEEGSEEGGGGETSGGAHGATVQRSINGSSSLK